MKLWILANIQNDGLFSEIRHQTWWSCRKLLKSDEIGKRKQFLPAKSMESLSTDTRQGLSHAPTRRFRRASFLSSAIPDGRRGIRGSRLLRRAVIRRLPRSHAPPLPPLPVCFPPIDRGTWALFRLSLSVRTRPREMKISVKFVKMYLWQ